MRNALADTFNALLDSFPIGHTNDPRREWVRQQRAKHRQEMADLRRRDRKAWRDH